MFLGTIVLVKGLELQEQSQRENIVDQCSFLKIPPIQRISISRILEILGKIKVRLKISSKPSNKARNPKKVRFNLFSLLFLTPCPGLRLVSLTYDNSRRISVAEIAMHHQSSSRIYKALGLVPVFTILVTIPKLEHEMDSGCIHPCYVRASSEGTNDVYLINVLSKTTYLNNIKGVSEVGRNF